MSPQNVLLVLCTASNETQAMPNAQTLVEREEPACVNLVPMIRSVCRWKGKVWNEAGQRPIIKTTAPAFEDVKRTVKELPSYELPEILALPVSGVEPNALAWIGSSVRHGRDNP